MQICAKHVKLSRPVPIPGALAVCQVCNNLEWDALISDISTYAKKEYQKLFEQQGQIQLALRKWLVSQSTHALPYLNESWLNPWKSKTIPGKAPQSVD